MVNVTRRIVFYCGPSPFEWAPPVLNTEGLGGSETAVIKIADLFQKAGWIVDVYCHAGRFEGEHDGVGYWEPERFRPATATDVLVSWRFPEGHTIPAPAKIKLLWLHDYNYGPERGESVAHPAWTKVLGVSRYHADMLARFYGLEPERVSYVPNGIDLDRFDPTIRKVPLRCVYASSPDRGLDVLLDVWPKIIGDEKGAELHIAYGFHTMDKMIEMGRKDLAEFKAGMQRKIEKAPNVVFRDRLPQDELARLYSESYVLLYPSHFLETFSITAVEAAAGGCVPITSSAGALKETVGDGGLIVFGPNGTRSNPYSSAWRDFYAQVARGVIFEMNTRKVLEARSREWAKQWTWEASFARWLEIVGEVDVLPDPTDKNLTDELSGNAIARSEIVDESPVLSTDGEHILLG